MCCARTAVLCRAVLSRAAAAAPQLLLAYDRLFVVVDALMSHIASVQKGLEAQRGPGATLSHDDANCALWLRIPNSSVRDKLRDFSLHLDCGAVNGEPIREHAANQTLRSPHGRDGSKLKKAHLYTCDVLDAALDTYRGACMHCLLPAWGVHACAHARRCIETAAAGRGSHCQMPDASLRALLHCYPAICWPPPPKMR